MLIINSWKTFHYYCENSIFCQSLLIVMSNWLRNVEFVKINFWLKIEIDSWLTKLLIDWLIELLTTKETNLLITKLTKLLTIELTKLLMTKSIKSWLLSTRISIDEKTMKSTKKKRDRDLIRFETTKKNLNDVSSIKYDFDVIIFVRKNVNELIFNQWR